MGHEFFCKEVGESASSMQVETALRSDVDKDEVLLQVMKIPQLDRDSGCKSVLWDTSCSSIFMTTEHAEVMNFPCQERKLCVRTLGGEEKEIKGKVYDCQIRDLKGKVY